MNEIQVLFNNNIILSLDHQTLKYMAMCLVLQNFGNKVFLLNVYGLILQ